MSSEVLFDPFYLWKSLCEEGTANVTVAHVTPWSNFAHTTSYHNWNHTEISLIFDVTLARRMLIIFFFTFFRYEGDADDDAEGH